MGIVSGPRGALRCTQPELPGRSWAVINDVPDSHRSKVAATLGETLVFFGCIDGSAREVTP